MRKKQTRDFRFKSSRDAGLKVSVFIVFSICAQEVKKTLPQARLIEYIHCNLYSDSMKQ